MKTNLSMTEMGRYDRALLPDPFSYTRVCITQIMDHTILPCREQPLGAEKKSLHNKRHRAGILPTRGQL